MYSRYVPSLNFLLGRARYIYLYIYKHTHANSAFSLSLLFTKTQPLYRFLLFDAISARPHARPVPPFWGANNYKASLRGNSKQRVNFPFARVKHGLVSTLSLGGGGWCSGSVASRCARAFSLPLSWPFAFRRSPSRSAHCV